MATLVSRVLWSAVLGLVTAFGIASLANVAYSAYVGRVFFLRTIRGDIFFYWDREPVRFILGVGMWLSVSLAIFAIFRPVLRKILDPEK